MPMTPFIGVRISWLMVARNSDFGFRRCLSIFSGFSEFGHIPGDLEFRFFYGSDVHDHSVPDKIARGLLLGHGAGGKPSHLLAATDAICSDESGIRSQCAAESCFTVRASSGYTAPRSR